VIWQDAVPILATVSSTDLFLSVLTIGEIRLGTERLRRKDPARADTIEQWLRGLQAGYRNHLIGVDAAVSPADGHC
jgi:predicted nucleic acid-binding protein